jgi:diguanylate cyclase (GGDEF)-like protein
VTQLQELLRGLPGPPEEVLHRVLVLACEQLELDLAFVGLIEGDERVVRFAAGADGARLPDVEGRREPLGETYCRHVVERDGLVERDTARDPDLARLALTSDLGIASYAGVPLVVDGRPVGTLCAVGGVRHATLHGRDLRLLRALAEVAAPLAAALDGPSPVVGTASERSATLADLDRVAAAVTAATDLETLARPLLDVLHEITGLASTYLTAVDLEAGVQHVRLAHNARPGFALPEGLEVPWADTLCKRSLDEGRACTTDVQDVWGDSVAARELGIAVYVSVPVQLSDGQLWGTLCGADAQPAGDADELARHLPALRLFARLIAGEVEREAAVVAAREDAARAAEDARTDPLTGLAARRVVEPWLSEQLAAVEPGEVVVVAYVDVDRFKAVNDTHGHAAGDAVLVAVAQHLRALARPADLVARLGGDEFVLAARLPVLGARTLSSRLAEHRQVVGPVPVTVSVGVALADGDLDAPALLAAADAAMYRSKRAGRDA